MISKLMLIEQKTLKQLIGNNTNVDVNIVKDILKLDPTLKSGIISNDTEIGIYGEWLLGKLYKNYNQLSNKDKDEIKEKLQFYDYLTRSKRIPKQYNNIYKIKSIEELIDIVNKIQGDTPITQDPILVAIINHKFKTVSGNPLDLLKQQYYGEIKENGNTKWIVFNPKNKEQGIVAGYNTSWCTSRDDFENKWKTYIYEGNTAWIFLLSGKYKTDNPTKYNKLASKKLDKVCIIVERGECRDKIDNQFRLNSLSEIGRFIENKIDSYEIKLESHDILHPNYREGIENILTGIKNPNNRLRLLLNEDKLGEIMPTLPDRDKQFYIKHYPHLALDIYGVTKENQIKFMPKISTHVSKVLQKLIDHNIEIDEDIQMQIISTSEYFIVELLKLGIIPHKNVQLQQVLQDGSLINDIILWGINPDKDIQLQQVSKNGYYIKYIKNPDEDVQLQQVKNTWKQIDHIENPDKEAQLQQVSQNINQILYIKNPDKEAQLQQVSQKGNLIRFIENPDKDIQLQQVNQDGYQIEYIENPDKDVQKQQVAQNAGQIAYIMLKKIKLDKDVQLQQASQNGYQIRDMIRNGIIPDKDVKLQQVNQNGFQIYYIYNPDKEVQLQQIKQNPEQYFDIKNPDPEQTQLYKRLSEIKESITYINKLLDVN